MRFDEGFWRDFWNLVGQNNAYVLKYIVNHTQWWAPVLENSKNSMYLWFVDIYVVFDIYVVLV